MIILHGAARSRATRTLWTLIELGLEWHSDRVVQAPRLRREGIDPLAPDAPRNTLSPDFLSLSPFGTIPALSDDGFILSESLAIGLYLAEKTGGPLAPRDLHERAQMTQWALYGATAIEPSALILDQNAATPDSSAADAARAALLRPLDVLEGHFATHSHLVADRFTVADINLAEIVRYAQAHASLFEARPALKSWLAACQSRPAFRQMWQMREQDL